MKNLNYYLHNDPRMPLAWAPWFSHEYITYFSVQAVDKIMTLPQVQVKPKPAFNDKNWPIGPKHIDLYKENYREVRKLDPQWSFSYTQRNGEFSAQPPLDKTIEPWKVLVIYSTEPDLNPDCDLDLHKNQKITGGSHGWRHMQFRALGKKFGVATESVRTHMDLAHMAFQSGNDYWGWRYLSRGTHYLADLGNPFHVYAVPSWFLIKNLFSSKKLFRIVSATHQSYEIYAQRRFREGFPAFQEALLQGAIIGQTAGRDVNAEINSYMHQAESRMKPIFHFFLDEFGQELINAYRQMDQNSQLDAAAQTNMCSKDAAAVIFQDSHLTALNFLDRITADILFDVGRMLGTLLNGFSSRKN
jgi:hypothetical protein